MVYICQKYTKGRTILNSRLQKYLLTMLKTYASIRLWTIHANLMQN